jgi:hypothetical protein
MNSEKTDTPKVPDQVFDIETPFGIKTVTIREFVPRKFTAAEFIELCEKGRK